MGRKVQSQGPTGRLPVRTAGRRVTRYGHEQPPKPRAGWARRITMITLGFAVPVAVLLSLAIGLTYVRLQHGPIAMSFLDGAIERGISAELSNLQALVEGAELGFDKDGDVELRLRNLTVREPNGDVVAAAQLAAVELSMSALWSLKVVPARIELIEPRLAVSYGADGAVKLVLARDMSDDLGALIRQAPELVSPPVPARKSQSAAGPVVSAQPEIDRPAIGEAIAVAVARTRLRSGATSYLRSVGLRNAQVSVVRDGQWTDWHVPSASLSFDRSRRNLVAGVASIDSPRGPWRISLQVRDAEAGAATEIAANIDGMNPSTLTRLLPDLGALRGLDAPVSGQSQITLSASGQILAARADVSIGRGTLLVEAMDTKSSIPLGDSAATVTYHSEQGRIALESANLQWSDSSMRLAGEMVRQGPESAAAWQFNVAALEGVLAAREFLAEPVPLTSWTLSGAYDPQSETVQVGKFEFAAGGGSIIATAVISTKSGDDSVRVDAGLSPMPAAALKALWPSYLGAGARAWVGTHVLGGTVRGGAIKYASGRYATGAPEAGQVAPELIAMSLDAEAADVTPLTGFPVLRVPSAKIRLDNTRLEVDVPQAAFALANGETVAIQGGRFMSADVAAPVPLGEIFLKTEGGLRPLLTLLQYPPLEIGKDLGIDTASIDGKAGGELLITVPLLADVEASAVKLRGSARITDGRAKKVGGNLDVQGATVGFTFTDQAADAEGQMLVNGVPAKLNWQRIFDAPDERQPPLRLTAKVDDAGRDRLGLDVNHIVQGDVDIELTVASAEGGASPVRMRADMTNAEILFEGIAWRKPPGRSAVLQCDIVKGANGATELQNFALVGDGVAVEGDLTIGPDQRLKSFRFPQFSVNVITRLQLEGVVGTDNILKVKARGPTVDGRDFFRSLFTIGRITDKDISPQKSRAGLDLDVEVDTVIGFSEVSLRGLKMKASKRADKLSALEGRGTLDGGKPLAFELRNEAGQPRRLLADSTDAGQAFRMIGFYPSIRDGRVRLEVNLDGSGAAEKTGNLWVDTFKILGDPVASEVFSAATDAGASSASARKQSQLVRQVFDFDQMRVPFSVGHGQFVMDNAYLRGPLLGASIRGKVDYAAQRVSLGGTYIPLQGINNVLAGVPLFGELLSGPRGEGIFGITFAIQGAMAQPEVIVNPLSIIAPGIFREIFQMTPYDPRVSPRTLETSGPAKRTGKSKADEPPAKGRAAAPAAKTGIADGWSSETTRAIK